MFKFVVMSSTLVFLCACESQPNPYVKTTLAKPGALGNVPVQENYVTPDGAYIVKVSDNRKVALVRTTSRAPTIAGVEAAAAQASNCTSKMVAQTYTATNGDRNAVIPPNEFGKFGGSMPAVLTCS